MSSFWALSFNESSAADVKADLPPEVTWLAQESPEVAMVTAPAGFDWRACYFVRHACRVEPVDAPLADAPLAIFQRWSWALEPGVPFAVQVRFLDTSAERPPKWHHTLAEPFVAQGHVLNVRSPGQILSVLVTPAGKIWAGLGTPAENRNPWAGGVVRLAATSQQISRAEFKLEEAWLLFGLPARGSGSALDLGAAPGGWTRVLRTHEYHVTAVDPAELDPRVTRDRGVVAIRSTAQEFFARNPRSFQMLVNDMRLDALESAALVAQAASFLDPGSPVILTLKLPKTGRPERVAAALAELERHYERQDVRQLYHNRSELTVFAAKR